MLVAGKPYVLPVYIINFTCPAIVKQRNREGYSKTIDFYIEV